MRVQQVRKNTQQIARGIGRTACPLRKLPKEFRSVSPDIEFGCVRVSILSLVSGLVRRVR